MIGRRALLLLLLLTVASALNGQSDPDMERGARPGLAYKADGIDQVNLFNGTMTVNIPIGPVFPVGGTLAYSFQASHGANMWETEYNEVEQPDGIYTQSAYMYPSEHSSAGFGWVVTLGALIERRDGTGMMYLAPDGGQHEFDRTQHPNEPETQSVSYTRDGTYLRRHIVGSGSQVHFPNGHVHTFDAGGRLTEMRDPFGNTVTLSYRNQISGEPYPGSTLTTITDSTGRSHKMYFRPNWSYDEIPMSGSTPAIEREMLHKMELAAFAGATAEYAFEYIASPQPGGLITTGHKTSRRCRLQTDPTLAGYVVTSLLSSITMPGAVQYSMEYDRGDQVNCSYNAPIKPLGASGNLTKLILPTGAGVTGGRIEWGYQKYIFGNARPSINAGVLEKKVFDGATLLAHTTYEAGTTPDVWRRVNHKDGSGTLINSTKHYFTACKPNPYGTGCRNGGEYGLPITRSQTQAGAFLSSEFEVPNSTIRRKTWLRYEGDRLLADSQQGSANQRVAYQRTDYEDGTFADVVFSDFDGLGHYRRAVTGGNFSSGNARTTYTNYNKDAGEYRLDAAGNLMPGFTMPATTAPWILTMYDKQWMSEGATTSAAAFCFDATTGFLTSRRIFKNSGESPLPLATDLLATYKQTSGNVTEERYAGGETGTQSPVNFACGTALAAETYRIDHSYQHRVRSGSRYVQANAGSMSFDLLDTDIDRNTGLVTTARRHSTTGLSDGVATVFDYDLLGRMKSATVEDSSAVNQLRTEYDYDVLPPAITVSDYGPDNVKIRESVAFFDAIGRLKRETRTMPGGVTAARETRYNGLGWVTDTFDWGATAATTYSYDAFGRPTRIRAPDHSDDTAPTMSYTGVSRVSRTVRIGTGAGTVTPSVTTEDYDRQGRLWRVTEPGQSVLTEYKYDVGGRLSEVCSNKSGNDCGQIRTFVYDNRGFLTSETHPENGTTTYSAYDARGHLRRRYLGAAGSAFDLGFEYDRAERLTKVYEVNANGSERRILKHFTFGTDNAGSDLRNGRLTSALRFNWIDIGGTVYNTRVVETYKYENGLGGISSRKTSADVCAVAGAQDCKSLNWQGSPADHREFDQTFSYDALGNTSALGYPECTSCPNLIGSRTITNGYSNGLLTSVTWTGAVVPNTFTYHPSGLTKEVRHDNGVTDETTVDPGIPSRPTSLITKNAEATGCVVPSFTKQPGSVTITAPASKTLEAEAVGETEQTVSYQWYQGTAPDRSTPIGTGSRLLPVAPTTTTSYWVEAWNSCSGTERTVSVTATVTVCIKPTATAPADRTITWSTSTTLTGSATGSATLRYQWSTVSGSTVRLINGATSNALTVSPTQTTTYRLTATNGCGSHSDDVRVLVVDPPTTPGAFTATYNSATGKNDLSWMASTSGVGIEYYEITRVPDGLTFTASCSPSTCLYADQTQLQPGRAYVYRIRAVDAQGVGSDESRDLATRVVFTSPDPIAAPGATPILGVYVSELRAAVDEVRVAAGLSRAWSSYSPATGPVNASIFTQLRDRLNEGRVQLLLPEIAFSDPVAAGQLIRRSCVNDLRWGVQ